VLTAKAQIKVRICSCDSLIAAPPPDGMPHEHRLTKRRAEMRHLCLTEAGSCVSCTRHIRHEHVVVQKLLVHHTVSQVLIRSGCLKYPSQCSADACCLPGHKEALPPIAAQQVECTVASLLHMSLVRQQQLMLDACLGTLSNCSGCACVLVVRMCAGGSHRVSGAAGEQCQAAAAAGRPRGRRHAPGHGRCGESGAYLHF
jgi:hypothetical protein